jgi:two-component system chemotaxis response regulator CheY
MAEPQIETRTMLVDDAAAIRSVLRMLLSHEGHKIVGEFGHGAKLLASVAQLKPHIICLDFNLPDSDGLSLLKEIHAAHPEVAVVMITANENPALEHEAAEAGATGFIRKPFTQDKIIKDLRQVVHAQRLMAAARRPGGNSPIEIRARAVIADDSKAMRQLLALILPQAGVEVVAVGFDGKQATELVAEHKPDIVCLDVDMPVMGGLEALKIIHAQNPTVKVLMVTANANRQIFAEAAQAGAKGYILKPYQPEKVIQAISQLIQTK